VCEFSVVAIWSMRATFALDGKIDEGNNVHVEGAKRRRSSPWLQLGAARDRLVLSPADKRRVNQRRDMHGMAEREREREFERNAPTPDL
jgi:hypothetical protein